MAASSAAAVERMASAATSPWSADCDDVGKGSDLGTVGSLGVDRADQLGGDVQGLGVVVEAGDTAAAVEVGADPHVVDPCDPNGMIDSRIGLKKQQSHGFLRRALQ